MAKKYELSLQGYEVISYITVLVFLPSTDSCVVYQRAPGMPSYFYELIRTRSFEFPMETAGLDRYLKFFVGRRIKYASPHVLLSRQRHKYPLLHLRDSSSMSITDLSRVSVSKEKIQR